ncbi:MAG: molybdopterin molybdotransferase MoeA [Geminicoccaceae bacterium]|nr:molybdopterin molybdotransferase MoeA [Geminicoccaceae bacterium]
MAAAAQEPALTCFAPHQGLLPVPEVERRLAELARPCVAGERVPLAHAAGRILAEPLLAPRDVPAFDNVAVDGWAFSSASLAAEGPTSLRILAGRAAAGHPFAGEVPPGHALQALTGAPMPAGTDTVAMWEECRVEDATVVIPAGYRPRANRRKAGEDIRAGATVLAAGTRLAPQHLGIAAELGLADLPVFAPLRVALLSSGDELLEPGRPFRAGCVYDANRAMLRALLERLPCTVTDLGILPDDGPSVRRTLLEAAAGHDVIVSSAGASKGAEDHLARTVASEGELAFWQIAMKPGRPFAAGRLGRATYVGLPGNPVAAIVCFLRFARPLLLALAGAPFAPPRPVLLPAAFSFTKGAGRTELLRARLIRTQDGGLAVERIPREGSGILTSLSEADGLVELAAERTRVEPGELVPYHALAALGCG